MRLSDLVPADRVDMLYRRAASTLDEVSAESPARQKQLVSQATTLLEEASALGHLPATILLSRLLLESQSPESRVLGLELLQRAADRGHVASLGRLGGMYLEGEEIAQVPFTESVPIMFENTCLHSKC
jgi:TPR repeat protein